jgi:hypothetical protein
MSGLVRMSMPLLPFLLQHGEDEDGDMVNDNVHLDNTDHGGGIVSSV